MENILVEKKTLNDYLNEVRYDNDPNYVPSVFALNYVNFIKLVNGEQGESHKTPVVHYKMLDQLAGKNRRLANLCSRGFGKTVLFGEYLFLYIAVFGGIDGFGDIDGAIYVSDSIENGVKSLRKNIEYRYHNSEFLQKFLSDVKFTDVYIEFKNKENKQFGLRMFGAKTGLRGTKIFGKRPTLAVLDDLVSDDDARSPTVMGAIRDTVYKGVDYALDPTKRKIVFSGTPFAQSDILVEAVESGGWTVNVYPICEEFPCEKKDFKGAWEDRFDYNFVKEQYTVAVATGQVSAFNQELMLRLMDENERVILDSDLIWYKRAKVIENKGSFNFYITTDFATSANNASDYSVISVWAYNNNGDWLWVDGICKRQLMDQNVNDLFRLAQMYQPQSVGIEVSGQQGGFISWIMDQMMVRNIYFPLASEGNNNKPGIRPNTNKIQRFNIVVPWFKAHKMWFPEEMKTSPELLEMQDEISLVAPGQFKSKHDDFLDTISMLANIRAWKPSIASVRKGPDGEDIWDDDIEEDSANLLSYIV